MTMSCCSGCSDDTSRFCRWTIGLTFLAIIVIMLTAATFMVTLPCRNHLMCDDQKLTETPYYWILILSLVTMMVTLMAALVRVLRLRRKWSEREKRMRIEFEMANFYVENIYENTDFNSPHYFNPNVNRLSRNYSVSYESLHNYQQK